MVKNNNFKKGVLAAMLLASPLVSAKSDYPAADFQPKVLYSDSDYKHTGSAPAATKSANKTQFDPNYPAATFEPKVVFQDTKYKHKKDVVTSSRSAPAPSVSNTGIQAEEAAKDSSDQTMLVGLIVLAAIGFFFFRKKSATAPKASGSVRRAPVSSVGKGGLTGVAKYLEGKEVKATGVAKYLASKQETAVTGVAKYMAKQVIAARKAAAENVTGVEKYLRNKG